MANKVIGGEFDINAGLINNYQPGSFEGAIYSSGRAALYHILLDIKSRGGYSKIFLPDYLCESVLDAVNRLDFDIYFYNLDHDLTFNQQSLAGMLDSSSILLIINYFGGIDCSVPVKFLKEAVSSLMVIQDNVQAFFEMNKITEADYSFTSFRKTFPVPDGAWVKSLSAGLNTATQTNTFAAYKIAGGILKNVIGSGGDHDEVYLNLLKQGEDKINDNYSAAASGLSLNLMNNIIQQEAALARRQNAEYILKGLANLNITPIVNFTEEQIPLFIPVRLKKRNEIRSAFFNQNIFCPVHWPVPEGLSLTRGLELSGSELSIVIDQRYTPADMERILTTLQKYSVNEI